MRDGGQTSSGDCSFNYKLAERGGGNRDAISHIFLNIFSCFVFFFYLLGGSASPPLASR